MSCVFISLNFHLDCCFGQSLSFILGVLLLVLLKTPSTSEIIINLKKLDADHHCKIIG